MPATVWFTSLPCSIQVRAHLTRTDCQFQPQQLHDVHGTSELEARLAAFQFRHETHADAAQARQLGLGQLEFASPLPDCRAQCLEHSIHTRLVMIFHNLMIFIFTGFQGIFLIIQALQA